MTANVTQPRTFTCVECGRGITAFGESFTPEKLCDACILLPAWFTDPAMRGLLCPDHDGREFDPAAGAQS